MYWPTNMSKALIDLYYFSPGHPKRTHQLTPRQNQELTAEGYRLIAQRSWIRSVRCITQRRDTMIITTAKEPPMVIFTDRFACFMSRVRPGHLRETRNGVRSFAWTIRNQAFGSYGTILAGYRLKDKLLAYQRDYYKNVKADIAKQPVKGYVFDTRGSRSVGYHFIENMGHHRINVYHLAKDFSVDGKTFKADEAFIIPVDQKKITR